jgi:hypothetical protein
MLKSRSMTFLPLQSSLSKAEGLPPAAKGLSAMCPDHTPSIMVGGPILGWREQTWSGRARGLPGPARWNFSWSIHQVGRPGRISALPGGDQPRIWTSSGPHPGFRSTACSTPMDTGSPRSWATRPAGTDHSWTPGPRARGRCENQIKTLKNTRPGKLPFFDFAENQAWANSPPWPSIWSPGSSSLPSRSATAPKPGTSNAVATGSSRLPPRVQVPATFSLSEYGVTRVASISVISGSAAVADKAGFPVPGGVPGPGAQFLGEGFEPVAEQLRMRDGAFEKPGHGRVGRQLTEDPG